MVLLPLVELCVCRLPLDGAVPAEGVLPDSQARRSHRRTAAHFLAPLRFTSSIASGTHTDSGPVQGFQQKIVRSSKKTITQSACGYRYIHGRSELSEPALIGGL